MSPATFFFLGAVSCAAASALFFVFARRAGDKTLALITGVATVALCLAALFLARAM